MISTETVMENAALVSEERLRKSIADLYHGQAQLKQQLLAEYQANCADRGTVSQLLRAESGITKAQQLLETVRMVRAQEESTAKLVQRLETDLNHAVQTRETLTNFRMYRTDLRKVMGCIKSQRDATDEFCKTKQEWRKILRIIHKVKLFDEHIMSRFLALDALIKVCGFFYSKRQTQEDYLELRSQLSGICNIQQVYLLIQQDALGLALLSSFFNHSVQSEVGSLHKEKLTHDDETNHSSNQKTSRKVLLGKRDSFVDEDMRDPHHPGFLSQESLYSKKHSTFLQDQAPGSVKPSLEGAKSAPPYLPRKPALDMSLCNLGDPGRSVWSCHDSPVTQDTDGQHGESAFDYKDCISNQAEPTDGVDQERPGMNLTSRIRLHGKREIYAVLADQLPLAVAKANALALETDIFSAHHRDLKRYRSEVRVCAKSLKSLVLQGCITSTVLSTRLNYQQIVSCATLDSLIDPAEVRDDDDISIRSFNSTASNLVVDTRLLEQIRKIPHEVAPKTATQTSPDSMDLIEAMNRLRCREIHSKNKKIEEMSLENQNLRQQIEPYKAQLKQHLSNLCNASPPSALPGLDLPAGLRI